MTMPRLILWPHMPAVNNHFILLIRRQDVISCIRQTQSLIRTNLNCLTGHPFIVVKKLIRFRFNTQCSIIEQAAPPVRMAHHFKKSDHSFCSRHQLQSQAIQARTNFRIDEIKHIKAVFQNHGVVHGASFKMPAIRQHLFPDLRINDLPPFFQPFFSLRAFEKQPPQHQCFTVFK